MPRRRPDSFESQISKHTCDNSISIYRHARRCSWRTRAGAWAWLPTWRWSVGLGTCRLAPSEIAKDSCGHPALDAPERGPGADTQSAHGWRVRRWRRQGGRPSTHWPTPSASRRDRNRHRERERERERDIELTCRASARTWQGKQLAIKNK